MQFLLYLLFCAFLPTPPAQEQANQATGGACELYNLVAEKGACTSDSTYSLTFDFEYQGVNGDTFDLWVNGHFHSSHPYAALPVTLPHFPKSGGSHDWIKVCDKGTPGCCKIKEFPTAECGGGQDCAINDLVVETGDCTSDSTYTLTLDFHAVNAGSTQFRLYANGTVFGDYDYTDLPLTIQDFPQSGGNNDWLKVCDKEWGSCCAIAEFPNPGCGEGSGDCQFKELSVVKECDGDSLFYVVIDFVPMNPVADGFRIKGNGVTYGEFPYSDLPVTLGPLPANCHTPYEFVIQDLENPDCKVVHELGKVCCGEPSDCQIKELQVIKECDGDSLFYVQIDFLPVQPGNQGFKIQGNGVQYGTFQYADLPILLGPLAADCHTAYEFLIQDIAHPDCKKAFDLGKVCCGQPSECQVKELHVDLGDCSSDSTYSFTLNFSVVPPSSGDFKLWVNGQELGQFPLSALPLLVEDVMASDEPKEKVKVCTSNAPICCGDLHFTPPACIHQPIEYLTLKGKSSAEGAINALADPGWPSSASRVSFTVLGPDGRPQPFTMHVEKERAWQIRLMDMQGRMLLEKQGTSLEGPGMILIPAEARSGILILHIQTGSWTEVYKLPVLE